MIELDGTLNELARLRSGSEPIVSLYLDLRWKDEQQRERVRLTVQDKVRRTLAHYPPGTPGRDALERTLQRVQEYVAGLAGQAYQADKNGLALFACESMNLWQPHFFRRSFTPELCTDGFPHLTQLVRLADDVEPAIVVAPSQEGADVFQVTLGDLAREERIHGFVWRGGEEQNAGTGGPMRRTTPSVPGGRLFEREEKNGRHQEEYLRKNRKAAAQQVVQLFDQTPGAHLVLVGITGQVAEFERELPERLRQRIIGRVPRPREWESSDGILRDGVVHEAAKLVAENEKKQEEKVIDGVVGEALRGGLGVLGPDDVVEALNQGRVHKLVLEEDFALSGWRCDNCDALGANAESAESCPYCGNHVHALGHLGEALVVRALAEGAEIDLVAHANKLHSYRGVGAFLRQTAATGLRGASHPWPTSPGASQPT